MTIYTLTLEDRPVSTTESLDHATAWKLKSKVHNYHELPHYDSAYLGVTEKDDRIFIDGTEPEEYLGEVIPDFHKDRLGYISIYSIEVDFFDNEVNLDKCNFTPELKREIDCAVENLRERKQEQAGRDEMHEAWMNGHEKV